VREAQEQVFSEQSRRHFFSTQKITALLSFAFFCFLLLSFAFFGLFKNHKKWLGLLRPGRRWCRPWGFANAASEQSPRWSLKSC
jgi:hypothetical protein